MPSSLNAGDAFYTVGVMLGIILWGFAIVWFIVAVIMMTISGKFPFNMGWWGFIFPIGELNAHLFLKFFIEDLASLIRPHLDRRLYASYDCNQRRIAVEVLQGTFLCKSKNYSSLLPRYTRF